MSGYTFDADGGYKSNLAGGNMTPTMVPSPAGKLLLLQTGANSSSITPPTISGWTKLTTNGASPHAACAALYGRYGVLGDTSPTFQWDATHQSYSRIVSFSGDVYTDMTTIVVVESERATNTTGKIAVNPTSAPGQSNCLVIRGGHCVKTATSNGATFTDWITDSGIYTKVNNTQLVQTGSAMAAGLWFWQQTTPTATSSDIAALSVTDASNNTQGFTVVLQPLAVGPPDALIGWARQTFVTETVFQF